MCLVISPHFCFLALGNDWTWSVSSNRNKFGQKVIPNGPHVRSVYTQWSCKTVWCLLWGHWGRLRIHTRSFDSELLQVTHAVTTSWRKVLENGKSVTDKAPSFIKVFHFPASMKLYYSMLLQEKCCRRHCLFCFFFFLANVPHQVASLSAHNHTTSVHK